MLPNVLLVQRTATALIGRLERRSLAMASKSRVRHPLAGVARRRLLEHGVDLLEGQTLCLGNKEVGKYNTSRAGSAPDEENFRLEVAVRLINHIWRDEGNDAIPKPVRC